MGQLDSSANPGDTPHARQMKYQSRVHDAIEHGRYWDMIWSELARDYNAAIANVLHLWRGVDTHYSEKTDHRNP